MPTKYQTLFSVFVINMVLIGSIFHNHVSSANPLKRSLSYGANTTCAVNHNNLVNKEATGKLRASNKNFQATASLFETSHWHARWNCGQWSDLHGWLYIISDFLVWLAYLAIPIILFYFIRRREKHLKETPFKGVLMLFILCITASGLSHLMDAATFWWPAYKFSALLKANTAVISIITVFALLKVTPKVMEFKSHRSLEHEVTRQTEELQRISNRIIQQQHGLTLLNDIAANTNLDYSDQFDRALAAAAKYLNLPCGIISQIEGNTYSVEYCISPQKAELKPGDEFNYKETYCSLTLEKNEVVAIHHMANSPYSKHPCYQLMKVETYIGVPLIVNDQTYGTVNFFSLEKRGEPFTENDKLFLRLLSKWVGATIERRIAVTMLKESEERFELAINGSSDGIWDWPNVEEDTVWWSSRFNQLIGYQDGELKTSLSTFKALLHPDDQSKVLQAIDDHFTKKSSYDIEYRLKHKAGYYKWFRARGQAIWDATGKILRMAGSLTEIQERKKVEHQLVQAREVAENATRAKSEFLSTMSHEIRTPLNAIVGISNFLIEDRPQKRQLKNLTTLKFSAENLMNIVNDILDYNAIESGKISLEQVPFNLVQQLGKIKDVFNLEAKAKKLHFKIMLDPSLPELILGDPHRLNQVLSNLISNALKFTARGGITIEVNVAREDLNYIYIKIAVIDTGIGIPEDRLASVFDKFLQIKNPESENTVGSGLGLAIVKQLLQLQGSKIEVESTVDQGSRFFFTLKFLKSGMTQRGIEAETTKLVHDHIRILLVEDNKFNQQVALNYLSKWGFTTDVVASGMEALAKTEQQHYNLILMDLQMPKMDGYQAAMEIRKKNKFEKPILALTAYAMPDLKKKTSAAGINDFITKPFDPEALYQKICELLELQNSKLSKADLALKAITDGNKEFSADIISAFTQELEMFVINYEKAMMLCDKEMLKKLKHKIKPSLEIFSFYELSDKIKGGQRTISNNPVSKTLVEENIKEVKLVCQNIINQFRT